MDQFSYIANGDVAAVESLYQQYLADPSSVDKSWEYFFKGFDFSKSWSSGEPLSEGQVSNAMLGKEREVVHLIRAYRSRGHLKAKIDPLYSERKYDANLDLSFFGLSEADLDTVFEAGVEVFKRPAKLREIIDFLSSAYCGNIGFEYIYIRNAEIKNWLRNKIESEYLSYNPGKEKKMRILNQLNKATAFENFLHTKFLGQKRFSIEGGESAIPGLDALIQSGASSGIEEVVIGMAHRGRLNILTNILQKPYDQVFNEFSENVPTMDTSEGDVKYHMGYSSQIETEEGHRVSLKMLPNPSHLEAVDPVVLGYARARADAHFESSGTKNNDREERYDKVLPILIHGDASLAGQGIVYEISQMSNLKGYYVGGTVHFVINNQLGFTATNEEGRSSIYSSDVAEMLDTPIFHVNGDDPESVVYAMELAIEYRQKFNKDVYIDMICYRKYGHNEADEPKFTQPMMYEIISKHSSPREIYIEKLKNEGTITDAYAQNLKDEFDHNLQDLLSKVKQNQLSYEFPQLERDWNKLRKAKKEDFNKSPETGISKDEIKLVGKALTSLPEGFTPLRQIERVIKERAEIFNGEKPFNWATAELLAYGSILSEDKWIRFTGQDVQRGTFSHRHSVLHDAKTGETYNNLSHIKEKQGAFEIYNSLLSEYAVMGYEYGYALANPSALTIWEAQFGDFANGSQIIIDQFVMAAEIKWKLMNGLVLLLPHGSEGQGPEHSSARPERFLQMAAQLNVYFCNCTTPANLFHMMRRQLAQPFRKPCINMSPKSMLRHHLAVSDVKEFETGTSFKEIYVDEKVKAAKVKRLVLCTGKIFYELFEKREELKRDDVALVRIEQLYPFPDEQVAAELNKYSKADVVWVQEEPENMGYWSFIQRELGDKVKTVVASKMSPSPAPGYAKSYKENQAQILDKVFKLD